MKNILHASSHDLGDLTFKKFRTLWITTIQELFRKPIPSKGWLTISAYVIGRHSLKQVNISEPLSVRKEMKEHPEESLWIHADDRGDIFRLQDVFGLHPLAVQAIVHTHQPSKVEEYDSYLFTIIDGVKYERQKRSGDKEGERQDEDISNSGSPSDNAYSDNDLEEDDLYIFLEQRWILLSISTVNSCRAISDKK
jgi:Mg2+ and Co2+ transporter CorA